MEQNFINTSSKQVFHSPSQLKKGKYYTKNVKYWVGVYSGFGIDYTVYEEVVASGKEGIIFDVKSTLEDYRTGRKMCPKGKYLATIEILQKYGRADTLNPKFGKQLFVPMSVCDRLGG